MANPSSPTQHNYPEHMQPTPEQSSPNNSSSICYQRASLIVRSIGFICCILSAGIMIVLLSSDVEIPPLVLGPIVLVNTPLILAIILALCCPILFHIALFLRPIQYRGGILKRIGRALVSAICSTVAIITLLYGALLFIIDEPYLLDPPSMNGDRILIVEHHFLLASSGDVYYVPSGSIVAETDGWFMCDDAYSPVRAHSYSLSWNERVAHLEIWSDSPADPMSRLIGDLGTQ